MSEVNPWYKRKWAVYGGGFIVIASLFSLFGGHEAAKELEGTAQQVAEKPAQVAEEKAAAAPSVETVELSLEDAVNEYLGDRRTFGQSVENGYYTIKTDFGRFVGREFSEKESLELAQLVSEHPDYAATGANGVMVEFISGLTDAYGNSEDGTVMYVGYTNETIDRINFESVDVANVVEIADEYFRVPAYK